MKIKNLVEKYTKWGVNFLCLCLLVGGVVPQVKAAEPKEVTIYWNAQQLLPTGITLGKAGLLNPVAVEANSVSGEIIPGRFEYQYAEEDPMSPNEPNFYTADENTVLTANGMMGLSSWTLVALFYPDNEQEYKSTSAFIMFNVYSDVMAGMMGGRIPIILWAPEEMMLPVGTSFSSKQLNARVIDANGNPLEADITYEVISESEESIIEEGSTLPVGVYSLFAVATLHDADYQEEVSLSHQFVVYGTSTQSAVVIKWNPFSPSVYGVELDDIHLNAVAYDETEVITLEGTFAYDPPAGTMLDAGKHTLKTTFTPKDTSKYKVTEATVEIEVSQAIPDMVWEPAPLNYPDPIGSAQLNAQAYDYAGNPLPGTYQYNVEEGTVLEPGLHTLMMFFTAEDTLNYSSNFPALVEIEVGGTIDPKPITPILSWVRSGDTIILTFVGKLYESSDMVNWTLRDAKEEIGSLTVPLSKEGKLFYRVSN